MVAEPVKRPLKSNGGRPLLLRHTGGIGGGRDETLSIRAGRGSASVVGDSVGTSRGGRGRGGRGASKDKDKGLARGGRSRSGVVATVAVDFDAARAVAWAASDGAGGFRAASGFMAAARNAGGFMDGARAISDIMAAGGLRVARGGFSIRYHVGNHSQNIARYFMDIRTSSHTYATGGTSYNEMWGGRSRSGVVATIAVDFDATRAVARAASDGAGSFRAASGFMAAARNAGGFMDVARATSDIMATGGLRAAKGGSSIRYHVGNHSQVNGS
ncbi:uncharacterized protein LOC132309165 [Cornus florida]|uniref:uncharacterized protein LOC132309165 n=1 Tax=Cornus florida TaxID=4283 RepID=UPI0028985034|nr:uncharacterized protein LOC132309165 [Cornus florida]